jgi:hypothetical protein
VVAPLALRDDGRPEPPLLVRVDLVRLATALARRGVTWRRLLIETGMDHATRGRLSAGDPVALEVVSVVARGLKRGADDRLAGGGGDVSRAPAALVRCSPRRIEAARTRAGLSGAKLARHGGLAKSSVQRLGLGYRVRLSTAQAVADAPGVPLDELGTTPGSSPSG